MANDIESAQADDDSFPGVSKGEPPPLLSFEESPFEEAVDDAFELVVSGRVDVSTAMPWLELVAVALAVVDARLLLVSVVLRLVLVDKEPSLDGPIEELACAVVLGAALVDCPYSDALAPEPDPPPKNSCAFLHRLCAPSPAKNAVMIFSPETPSFPQLYLTLGVKLLRANTHALLHALPLKSAGEHPPTSIV